jgi:hypothetical protein
MDSPPSKVEWHLVRDGKPYGPLSDLEFLKFIELGQLQANDLLWRDGFNEWKSAIVLFPELQELPSPTHTEPVECSSTLGEPLVDHRPAHRKAKSRKARVLSLLIVVLGGAASYAYFRPDWLLSETAIFLAQLLAL